MAANMNALPDEILYYVCDYLETMDKLRLASVCQRLRKILSSPLLNKKASFKHCWHIPYKAIQQYLEKNKEYIQKLELQDCYWLKQAQLVRNLKKCTNLVSLDVSGCCVSQKKVIEIMEKCSNLQHFGWTVDKKCIDNPIADAPVQVKQLNACFKKLSSIKLVLYKEKEAKFNDLANIHLLKQLLICKFLLSNLRLKRLELNLFKEGYNVSYPFDIAMETKNDIHLEILKSQSRHLAVFIRSFPLNNSTTVNFLSFSSTYGPFQPVYWEDDLLDDSLHLRNIDISGTRIKKINKEDIFSRLLSCPSLEFIKIGSGECSGEDLLSICSPVLESINLKNSTHSLDSDFLVLENLLEKCPRLKHINLLNTHKSHHCTSDHSKNFMKTLSSFKSLASLAVNPCCIRANGSVENSSHQNCDKAGISLTLAALVESCTQMTEFELIDSEFKSDITKHDRRSVPSDVAITLSLDTLTSLSQWKYLQKLTLAGFQVNRADFFIAICKECTELKSLSIAHLKGPTLSHSGNVACLNKALTHCHNLLDLRLEQPHFNITKHFLNALHNAKKLERICLMVNHGKLAVEEIEPWLNKCSKVIFVQMFCDLTLTLCKTLKEQLESKYGPHRPAFTASFFAFHGNTRLSIPQTMGPQSPKKITPLVHLQEMTMFTSRVASSYRLSDKL